MELIAGSFLLTARVALAGGVWAGGGGGWRARMGRVMALGEQQTLQEEVGKE